MALNEYDKIIREYFDLSDKYTRTTILETEDSQIVSALAKALYDKIVSRVDKIDFGTIPKSRGDITKVDGFDNTVECLNIMRRLVIEYKENPQIVDTVITAINNIRDSKTMFIKAFSLNVELVTMIYNLLVLSIEHSVSFLIAVTIQYVKDPASQTLRAALDKEAYQDVKGNVLYQQLESFNASYMSGEFVNMMNEAISKGGKISESLESFCPNCGSYPCICSTAEEAPADDEPTESPFADDDKSDEAEYVDYVLQQKDAPTAGSEVPPTNDEEEEGPVEPVNGSTDGEVNEATITNTIQNIMDLNKGAKWFGAFGKAAISVSALAIGARLSVWLVRVCLPMIRSIAFFTSHTIVKFSDSLATQAQFIELNARDLEYSSTMDEDKKKKVVDRQLKVADRLRRLANFFSIDNKKASKAAKDDATKENKSKIVIPDNPADDGDNGSVF